MIRILPNAVVALLFFAATSFGQAAARPERSVSSSRQFIVYGDDVRLRGAIGDLAERTKSDALRLLGGRDGWETPIVIQAKVARPDQPEAPVAQLQVNQTGAGLKFQLQLGITADVRIPEMERELLRAIVLEMMYRAQPGLPAGTPYVNPPDWLLEGILALAHEKDTTFLAPTLTTAAAGQMLTLENFLRQKRALLDSPSQILYRAYSAALVSVLLESADGRARLARFVFELDQSSNDPLADLLARFPGIGTNAAQANASWRASVVRLAGSAHFRTLSCEESERELAQILRVTIPASSAANVYTLEEAPRFVRDPAAVADLQRMSSELLVLSGRVHPLYRPVVSEYQRIAAQLLRRKAPRPRRLADLRAEREDLARRMNAIADYLNWFEATQARVASGTFQDYLRAAEEAQAPIPRRRDRISVYLDALEAQF